MARCEASVKQRGRGNHGAGFCSRRAVPGTNYCAQHRGVFKRGAAKLSAYAAQRKYSNRGADDQ